MEEIINALLDVVREQQRNGVPPEAAMSRSDVVNMALKMMEQQGTDIEQETVTETWRTILRLAPKLFGSDTSDVPAAALSPSEQLIRHMEPDKNITAGNENIALDKMIFNNFQSMLGGAGGEIKTESAPAEPQPKVQERPKSAAELAAEAIRIADENKRKGIVPEQKRGSGKTPMTNKRKYKGIPKAAPTVKGGDGQGQSASQLAYEAQRRAEERAREEARVRAELEAKLAEEAMKRGEPDPRIVAAEEQAKREAAEREMEIKRAERDGTPIPPASEGAPRREETMEEKRARVEAEQEARRAREWAEAEAEAKAAKERARAEREARIMAEDAKAKAERERSRMSPEEAKAAEERAARRAKAKEEAEKAKAAKSEQTRSEAAKLIQERAEAKVEKAAQTTKKAVESIQMGMAAALGEDAAEQLELNEEELNKLVMEKYQDMIKSGTKASDIDMVKLSSMVIDALQNPPVDDEPIQDDLDELIEETWYGDKKESDDTETAGDSEEKPEEKIEEAPAQKQVEAKEPAVVSRRQEKPQQPAKPEAQKKVVKPERKPKPARKEIVFDDDIFSSIKNVKSLMGDFEDFLNSSKEQKRIHTGIEPVDQLLSEGLEPGLYVVWAEESINADAFQLQIGDYMASQGKNVLYLLSDSSRYGMMVKSISRLTYELRGQDKGMARSAASIMNCQTKADMANLRKEFSHYEEQIGENLYLLEQKTMDSENITELIQKLTAAFMKEQENKPVILVDDIYWMLQDGEDLLTELAELAESMELPIMVSVGAGAFEDEDFVSTLIRIRYTGQEDDREKLLEKEIQAENGETLLADLKITRRDTGKQMSSRMAVTPKYHYFGKVTGKMNLS